MAISCDPNSLLAAANCIQSCLTEGQMQAIQTKLLCDIASVFTGGSGGGGTGPWVLKAGDTMTGTLSIMGTGKLGVGITVPSANFHTSLDAITPDATLVSASDNILLSKSAGGVNLKLLTTRSGGGNAPPTIVGVNTRGTLTVPIVSTNGDTLFNILAQGYDGASRQTAASVGFISDGAPAAGFVPGAIIFSTGTTSVANAEKMRLTSVGLLSVINAALIQNATAIPAGGTAGAGYMFSSTSNFGIFFGSNAPSLVAAKGSLYLRSNGSTTNDRAYIATDSAGTWTAIITVA